MVQEQQKLQQNTKEKEKVNLNVITSCHNSQMHL